MLTWHLWTYGLRTTQDNRPLSLIFFNYLSSTVKRLQKAVICHIFPCLRLLTYFYDCNFSTLLSLENYHSCPLCTPRREYLFISSTANTFLCCCASKPVHCFYSQQYNPIQGKQSWNNRFREKTLLSLYWCVWRTSLRLCSYTWVHTSNINHVDAPQCCKVGWWFAYVIKTHYDDY